MLILNYLAYCDTVICEKYFLQMHPGILKQSSLVGNEDNFEELHQGIGYLNRFGWIESISKDRDCSTCIRYKKSNSQTIDSLVEPSNTSDLKKYSIHNCY